MSSSEESVKRDLERNGLPPEGTEELDFDAWMQTYLGVDIGALRAGADANDVAHSKAPQEPVPPAEPAPSAPALSAAEVSAIEILARAEAGDVRPAQLRAALLTGLQTHPDLLSTLLAREPEKGGRLLDGLVADLDGKAKRPDERRFVAEALKARYGIDALEGEMTTKSLPRFYAVLGKVPLSHTKDNEHLQKIRRGKTVKASWHRGSEIEINIPRSSGFIAFGQDLVGQMIPSVRLREVRGHGLVSRFDLITLHEVGHAVDEQNTYMGTHGDAPDHGGWREAIEVSDIVDLMMDDLGFAASFGDYSREFLRRYLKAWVDDGTDPRGTADLQTLWRDQVELASLEIEPAELTADRALLSAEQILRAPGFEHSAKVALNNDMKSEQGLRMRGSLLTGGKAKVASKVFRLLVEGRTLVDAVDSVLAGLPPNVPRDATPDWKGMAKHAALRWLDDHRLHGEHKGLWTRWSKAKPVKDGKIYQEAYERNWVCYDASERANCVSHYQFRAPGEWFAEAYAAHFLGKLPAQHPLSAWLNEQGPPADA